MSGTAAGAPPLDRTRHRADVQGLRAVAVLAVVAYHAGGWLPGGFVGVDVFFVISGYVIGARVRREVAATGRLDVGDFAARRVRRILPAVAVANLVTLAAVVVVLSPTGAQQWAAKTALAASGFATNVYVTITGGGYFDARDETNPFVHLWSLAVEEQFYAVFPLVVAGVVALRRRARVARGPVLAVGAIVAGASLVAGVVLSRSGGSAGRAGFYLPVTRVWEFAAGIAVAEAEARRGRRTELGAGSDAGAASPVSGAALRGLVLVVLAAVAFDATTPYPGWAAIVPVAGTVAVLAAPPSHLTDRVLGNRVLGWIGDVSFGWYLWHWPAIVLADAVWPARRWVQLVAGVAALVPAAASWRWVERPIRGATAVRGWRAVGAATLLTGVPALAAVGVLAGAHARWGLDVPEVLGRDTIARTSRCFDTRPADWPGPCAYPAPGGAARGTALLIGDSHAASASSGFVAAAHAVGLDAHVWAQGGCPFLVGRAPVGSGSCGDWQRGALEAVDRLDPVVVVIANRSSWYTLPTVPGERSLLTVAAADGGMPDDRDEAVRSWSEGLDAALSALGDRGIPTAVLAVVPEYPRAFTDQISLLRPHPAVPVLEPSYVEQRRGAVTAAERSVVQRHPGAVLVDPVPVLCDPRCRPRHGTTWWYADDDHLNDAGSRRLAPLFEPVLGDALLRPAR